MADVFGRPITASAVNESSARGAALIALRDSGLLDHSGVRSAPLGQVYEPRRNYHERHLEARWRQQILYDREVGPHGANLLARQTR
jgi:glycerol kinase